MGIASDRERGTPDYNFVSGCNFGGVPTGTRRRVENDDYGSGDARGATCAAQSKATVTTLTDLSLDEMTASRTTAQSSPVISPVQMTTWVLV